MSQIIAFKLQLEQETKPGQSFRFNHLEREWVS